MENEELIKYGWEEGEFPPPNSHSHSPLSLSLSTRNEGQALFIAHSTQIFGFTLTT